MDEQTLRSLVADLKAGKLSRRAFVWRMVTLGLTAPMASQMLDHSGVARAQPPLHCEPTRRGGGGALKVL
jgi:peptide/nickel transport system substrate-binding protein